MMQHRCCVLAGLTLSWSLMLDKCGSQLAACWSHIECNAGGAVCYSTYTAIPFSQGSFGNRNLTFGLVWLVMGVLCGIITVTYLLVGWKQLWSRRERRAFLEQRWAAGDVHGPSRRHGYANSQH